MVDKCK